MKDSNEERLIQKVRKLFALSANAGATGAEAETALRMANALLDKHKIDKAKLHETEVVFASFADYPIKTKWVRSVVSIVSSFYNCKVVFDYKWDMPKAVIIGTMTNRSTAMIVIDQLVIQIKHEIRGKKAVFVNGVVIGLNDKCYEILAARRRKEGHVEAVPGTGLTVIDIDKQQLMSAKDFMDANYSDLRYTKARSVKYSQDGRNYGKGLGVSPQGRVGAQKCLS